MKKNYYYVFLVILSFCFISCLTIKPKEEIVYEKELSCNPSINVARLWVSENFNSASSVIDVYDESLQILTGNGSSGDYKFFFKITIKDNIVRINFRKFLRQNSNGGIAPLFFYETEEEKMFYKKINSISDSLFLYLEAFNSQP